MEEMVIKVISASWCSSCQSLKHSLEQNNIEYTLVDADNFANQEYIAKLGVRSLPVTIIEVDGVVVYQKAGILPVKQIVEQINMLKGV